MKITDKKNIAYNTALCGILCAQAVVLSWLEGMLPAFPYMPPGAKPGFSNIITMFAAGSVGLPQAIAITFFKALFAFITRGATAGLMSLSGGVLSTIVMWFMLKYLSSAFGIIGVSIVSAVAHNLGQLAVAAFITGTSSVLHYAPFLAVYAVITGSITGLLLKAIIPVLNKQKNLFIK